MKWDKREAGQLETDSETDRKEKRDGQRFESYFSSSSFFFDSSPIICMNICSIPLIRFSISQSRSDSDGNDLGADADVDSEAAAISVEAVEAPARTTEA